jgi:polar amino acid transport system substrate-binding protein
MCPLVLLAYVKQEPSPLRVITQEWPLLNYTEDGEIKGFATEVMRLVMKELKVNYQIEVLPGPRVLKALNEGPRVLYFAFIYTPERKPLYKWIGTFGNETIYFYKKKGSKLKINTLADAKKVSSVCCRDNGLVFDYLKKAGFQNLDVSVDPTGLYLKAVRGRCDLVIGETADGVAYWLKKSNLSEDSLEQTSVKISDSSVYVVASMDVPDEEISRWHRALEKVKTTAEFAKLSKDYQGISK